MSKKQDIFEDEESIEKESPLLNSISRENPFSVPENYFESLPSEIIEKCRTQSEPKKWGEGILTTILSYKWRLLAMTGCLAVICFSVIRLNNNLVSYEAMAQTIPDSLIVEHLDKNIDYISEATLEDLEEPENSASSVKSTSDSTNTDQEIIAYLMNSNVSVSDIENE
jgi:hypothetical protein